MLRFYSILATILVHISISAQQNGYIIDYRYDTVMGSFPGYKQWITNPGKVTFKNISGELQTLTPANCRLFHIDRYDTYVSFIGNRMINPITYATAAADDHADVYDSVTVFLRVIAASEQYTFYALQDKHRLNLYYSGDGLSFIELKQKASFIDNSFWQSMTYKQQLKVLFPEKAADIDRMMYAEGSVASLVSNQNSKKGIARGPNKNNGLIVSAGISINSLSFNQVNSYNFSGRQFGSATVPLAAAGYMVTINRNFSRLFLLPQVKVFSFKHHGSTAYNNGYPVFINTFQSSPAITLDLHLGYNILNVKNCKISIAPGVGFHYMPGNKQTDESKYSETNITQVVTKMDHATALFNLQLMGIVKNRFVVWCAYNLPAPVTSYTTASGKLTSVQMAVGYKF